MKKSLFAQWKIFPIWLIVLSAILLADPAKKISITKVTAEASETSISLCANLNKFIYSSDGTAAKPYVKLTPNDYFNVTLSYAGICLTGLKPRRDYQFTINRNIPLGEFKLDRDYTLSKTTTDYEPSLNFKDSGYILPAQGEISIPIETINTHELSVSLYRINTKNLIGKINDYGLVRNLYGYKLNKIADTDGFFLWKKRLKVRSTINKPKVTAIPVGDFLKEKKPGVYILAAQIVNREGEVADLYDAVTQWFMISDIGLYTLRSDDGLHVYTRTLSTAKIYDNVKLELISKNNEILDTVHSKNGEAFFPDKLLNGKRGLKAKAIYAYGKNDDFSIIDLSKPAHDLSDRGVQGRDNPGKYDAFIYSDRGIFRPGETVPLHILVRNKLGNAESEVKLSLKLFDSRQVEISSRMLTSDALGYTDTMLNISESASTGRWHARLYAGSENTIGSLSFLMEDFVPPKIKVDIDSSITELKPKEKIFIEATASYLNGMPLSNADVEVNTIIHRAKKPFKGYETYHFGDIVQRFGNIFLASTNFETDEQGKARIPFVIDEAPESTLPLSAHITISVNEPGGRPLEKVIDAFLADKSGYIGIKANFDNDAVDMESHPTFNIVFLKHSHLTARELNYRVVEEQAHWHWRSKGDGWEYYKTYSDAQEISKGVIQTSQKQPNTLSLEKLDWGSYRLEITDEEKENIITTYRFSSGYEEGMSKSSPDRLPVAIDKKSYHIGDQIRVNITPKFSGPVLVSVANHTIIETKTIQAVAGEEQEVTFTVNDNWGSSAYILATAFRAQSKKLGANRAIGLAHLTIINPKQMLNLTLEHPQRVKSSEPVKVNISAKEAAGKKVYFTLAAVDDGVLRLTNYQAPDPKKYFFGQQKLGIEIRDIYADLIKAMGAHAQFNVGAGDELEDAIQDAVTANKRKVVAIMTQALTFDKDGKAEVVFDIPDYQGSLKLMAVAWSENAVGSQSSDMVVKDSISPEIYMPRFLSVGDRVNSLLTVDFDASAEPGKYRITFRNENREGIIDQEHFDFEFNGIKPARFSSSVEIKATSHHDNTLTAKITHDSRVKSQKQWELGVRTKYPQAYIHKVGVVEKNALFDPVALLDYSVWSDIHAIDLKMSGKPLLSIESMADELIAYSGRCAEQTTSRAMPWLFISETMAQSQTINRKAIIQPSIDQLLDHQKLDGGFSLWNSSKAGLWISSYVLDFLTRAKKAGYNVPERNINAGLDWIENSLDRWSSDGSKQEADAYALYVLALSGRILMSEIVFHAKAENSKIKSAQAWGHLGAALAHVGEKQLAVKMFEKAKSSLGNYLQNDGGYYANYGGGLRDEAALVILMHDSGLGLDWESSFADLALSAKERKYFSTQEMSLLLRAAYTTHIKPVKLNLTAEGKALPLTQGEYSTEAKRARDLPTITNESSDKCWYSVSFQATPIAKTYSSKHNHGFALSKKIYTMQGKEIDPAHIKQNMRLVVVIEGKIESNHIKNPLISDWIPAGFELENPVINGIDATTGLKWLGDQSPTENIAYRNDRYEAALRLDSDKNSSFKVAYIVRAVSKGSFTLPPAKIEDMYQPRFRALSTLLPYQITIGDIQSAAVPTPPSDMTGKKDTSVPEKLGEKEYQEAYSGVVKNLNRYKITQLNFLRNSIFAHAGLDFEKTNPMLHAMFSEFSWYQPGSTKSGTIYKNLTSQQKQNIQTLLSEEKRRGGGLVLNDFYRVHNKLLTEKDLENYDKNQLYILRNSLFARRGVTFTNPDLKEIFSFMPWYRPSDISSGTVFDQQMSEQEKANIKLMIKMAKSK
ncbi:MAG: YARHG domain-containing protein [Campylobacterota bacterium]|nr:YARHG domain-containing protein [Campylobacterota bacterium]